MSETTLSRDALLGYFAQTQDPRSVIAAQAAIDGLGWADKPAFTRQDVLAITWRIASDAGQELRASDDPELREAGEAMAPMIELTRKQIAKIHPANAK